MNDYSVIINNRSFNLPKFTAKIRAKIESINKNNQNTSISFETNYRNMLTFVKDLIGEDGAKEIFECTDFNDMDLNDIAVAYFSIVSAYEKPIQEMTSEENMINISDKDRELVESLIKNAGSIEKLANQETFNKGKVNSFTSSLR